MSLPLEGVAPVPEQGIFPAGTRSVAIGVIISGLSAYIFLGLVRPTSRPGPLRPARCVLVDNVPVRPGCFVILEKRSAVNCPTPEPGRYPAPIARRVGSQGLVMALALILVAAAASPLSCGLACSMGARSSWPLS